MGVDTVEEGQIRLCRPCELQHQVNFLDVLFHGQSVYNVGLYGNTQADTLLEQARVEQDSVQRLQLYQDAEGLILDDLAAIPLWYRRNYVLVKPYVTDWSLSSNGVMADLLSVSLDH